MAEVVHHIRPLALGGTHDVHIALHFERRLQRFTPTEAESTPTESERTATLSKLATLWIQTPAADDDDE